MAQSSITSFFTTRKRAIAGDIVNTKTLSLSQDIDNERQQHHNVSNLKQQTGMRTRSGRVIKRSGFQDTVEIAECRVSPRKISKVEGVTKDQKKVPIFSKKGCLSPRTTVRTVAKSKQKLNEITLCPANNTLVTDSTTKNSAFHDENSLRTPTKQVIKICEAPKPVELKSLVKKELNYDEIKTKISKSAKLQELKASLARIQEIEKTRKIQEEKARSVPAKKITIAQLKEFDTAQLEVFSSPSKVLKTPTNTPPSTPGKNELMSTRHTDVSKNLLFSPSKDDSPSKMVVVPAYHRFLNLTKAQKYEQLHLPFKYRHLLEIFKSLDTVCAMLHNRKECITFKKLKPPVQRMLRKNFNEKHLAQIKTISPDAYIFTQTKMRNYGSTSKTDYFQLVITPKLGNVVEPQTLCKVDENNILAAAENSAMNPQIITQRLQHFHLGLLQRVKDEHDKFLKSLNPPLSIPKEKVTRWHPDFDLENCPDIELAHLPQPPNVQKYSSAKDILLTSRNLFHSNIREGKVMEFNENKQNQTEETINLKKQHDFNDNSKAETGLETKEENKTADLIKSTDLLKGIPKALLDKIRAKEAANAVEAMTRRPSQTQEAVQYSRLPELARYLRNVFVTERKGVLTQEFIIKKVQNSFRACLSSQEIQHHLQLIAKEMPTWLAFHDVRKTMYLKINKEMELAEVIERLESVANSKSKV
uniref:CDT1 Geminin-binding domain-containing protein n=1 Tax=Glossina morsitans morsitans TaxID=37546 RepID=A0A1B0GBN5_GLOMM